MSTELDKKEDLICKIKELSATDVQLVKVFIAGMDAERSVRECDRGERLAQQEGN